MVSLRYELPAALLPWAQEQDTTTATDTADGMADAVMAVMQGFMVRLMVDRPPGDHDASSAARLPPFGQGVYDLWRARHIEPGRT